MITKKIFSLFCFLSVIFLLQWIGHTLTVSSVDSWYLTLKKPTWTPPGWVFGLIWTILYIGIGISGWVIFIKVQSFEKGKKPFLVYALQLIFNLLWSYFFFFLKSPLLAFIDILLLLVMIVINIIVFFRIYRPAGLLLIPYSIWIGYAAILNGVIWSLNR